MVRPNTPPGSHPNGQPQPNMLQSILQGMVPGFTMAAPLPADFKTVQPKDDPGFIARYSKTAECAQADVKVYESNPCPMADLAMYEAKIVAFVCQQTVAAAFTGDTSKLQALLDKVGELKKS